MLAARFLGEGRVRVDDVPIPTPGAGEILVKVDSCALCGSDRRGWTNGSPVTPGHETSGTVVATGSGVVEPIPGTTGVVFLVDACGACLSCRSGSANRCLRKRAMYGFTAPGGFAELVAVRAGCFLPVAPEIPLNAATALLDLFGTTSHAFRLARQPPMGSVLVIGCGPIGLGAITVARAAGARHVVGIDLSRDRLELARTAGASPVEATVPGSETDVREIAPDGFDVVIEAAGSARTQRQALEHVAAGGVVVFIAHGASPFELHPSTDLIAREIAVIGSEYFRPDEFPENHERLRTGEWDPAPLITHEFPLERAEEACETFFGGATGKILVRP
jgi:threonine dehydrogenase-like Zn-dependent dehydrogenase